jgi:hypothetical protein
MFEFLVVHFDVLALRDLIFPANVFASDGLAAPPTPG